MCVCVCVISCISACFLDTGVCAKTVCLCHIKKGSVCVCVFFIVISIAYTLAAHVCYLHNTGLYVYSCI